MSWLTLMSSPQSYVLEGYSLLQFVQHVIDNHTTASWCIVCSSKEEFLARLDQSLKQPATSPTSHRDVNDLDFAAAYLQRSLGSRLTMRLLASCNTLRIAFVSDMHHLRAFLSSLSTSAIVENNTHMPARSVIAILDPISIHKSTTSYSAQGFNRTFALAIDAADVHGSSLVLCETLPHHNHSDDSHEAHSHGEGDQIPTRVRSSPWDDDVGIIDVRTKTFGPGSRGWAGRTIKIRQVVERWMTFQLAAR